MYQALYRKWRPTTFDEVYGQEHITTILRGQVAAGRTSHAYVFIGTRGTGKTSCAKILAKAVNCLEPVNGNPCNKCESCVGIDSGAVLDVVELDAASNNGVDHVRALRDEALYAPGSVRLRVYIVDEVHMLSVAAFNALLKILEEPPEHLMFILATTELHKVPATVLSRCQRHSFRRADDSVVAEHLRRVSEVEGIALAPDASELLARLAEGSFRDALSLLDQCASGGTVDLGTVEELLGLGGGERISELLERILAHDTQSALSIFDELWRAGRSPATLLDELSRLLRDILLLQVAPGGGALLLSGTHDRERLRRFGTQSAPHRFMEALRTVQSAIAELRLTTAPRVTAELALIALSGAAELAVPEPIPETKPLPEPEPEPEPLPEPEPEPIPEPEPEPEPEPIPEPEIANDTVFEDAPEKLRYALGDRLKAQDFALIVNSRIFTVDNTLVLSANEDFTYGQLIKPKVADLIYDCVRELFGGSMTLRISNGEFPQMEADTKQKLIDNLGASGLLLIEE